MKNSLKGPVDLYIWKHYCFDTFEEVRDLDKGILQSVKSSEGTVWEKRIEKLNQIGIALSSELNLERLLELIVREARGFTRADAGSLYTVDDGQLTFRVAQNETLSGRREPHPGFKPRRLPLSEKSIAGYAALTGEVLNIENVYGLPETVPYAFNADFDRRNHYVTKALLVVPMKDREKQTVGVLQLINPMDETGKVTSFPQSVEYLIMSLASQAAVAIRNARLIADIKGLLDALIQYSASAIDARSPHTADHSKRVAAYARAIAGAINDEATGPFAKVFFSPEQMEELLYAAWLHDIGKIGVPEQILDKQNRLSEEAMATVATRFELIKALGLARAFRAGCGGNQSDASGDRVRDETRRMVQETEELLNFIRHVNESKILTEGDLGKLRVLGSKTFEDSDGHVRPYLTAEEMESLSVPKGNLTASEYKRIQTHVEATFNIVKKIPFPKHLRNVPLFSAMHHELLDGTGYPRGLKGDEIPIQSRILAVVDMFDALTAADRPYRGAATPEESGRALKAAAKAGRLDGDIVNLFLEKELYKV
jgi:HD-GYP domain-containing protein (c-di-GMP phosphodiesterase class II)